MAIPGVPASIVWISFLWVICFLQLATASGPDRGSDGDNCAAKGATSDADDDGNGSSCRPEQPVGSVASSGSQRKWKWDPTSESHPCTIRRVSRSELLRSHGEDGLPNLYPHPLVIYPSDDESGGSKRRREEFANLTTMENLPSNFPSGFDVTLTGSDSLSSHRRTIPLKQYLTEVLTANGGSGETLPDQLGNETWYLFGETFSDEWSAFLGNYTLPPCQSCTPLHREQNMIALSFGIGNIGSGVQWHLHGPGFSETVHGRKHWVLYPPESRPEYDLDYASRHWMENTYTSLEDWTEAEVQEERKGHDAFLQKMHDRRVSGHEAKGRGIERESGKGPSIKKPWECTIHEGEMIYFPDQWHHATINLERYTVFVSSFTTEHHEWRD